jgi:hypothetical protein
VELFEAIRREYQFGVGTVKGVARKFGVHRRMVREAPGRTVRSTVCAFSVQVDSGKPLLNAS